MARGFTTISERFKLDPQGLTRLMNSFLTPLTNAIIDRKGTIDKYMGDAIMAFWNAPLDELSLKMLEGYRSREWDSVMAIIDASRGLADHFGWMSCWNYIASGFASSEKTRRPTTGTASLPCRPNR